MEERAEEYRKRGVAPLRGRGLKRPFTYPFDPSAKSLPYGGVD